MKLPQHLCENVGFMFSSADELISAMGNVDTQETDEIRRLFDLGLPPITSFDSLAVMFGYNPGFIVSMIKSQKAHYRVFEIPKGRSVRTIMAPKVGLKGVQKWLSVRFQSKFQPLHNVHGFVPGRSHLSAAASHLGAEWVASIDIEDFFPSVNTGRIVEALSHLGYKSERSLVLVSRLCSMRGNLVQGSPCSPVISNIVLRNLDSRLKEYATDRTLTYTRYADDIVLSGTGEPPYELIPFLNNLIVNDGWTVSERKTRLDRLPNRLKVHGLLVHGDKIRLTKGYRNRIRAYRHLQANEAIREDDIAKVSGHLNYAGQVERFSGD